MQKEIARRAITKRDLDKVMKGKHKKIKLWKNFTIGFEIEIETSLVDPDGDDFDRDVEDYISDNEDSFRNDFLLANPNLVETLDENNFTDVIRDVTFKSEREILSYLKFSPKYGFACPLLLRNKYKFFHIKELIKKNEDIPLKEAWWLMKNFHENQLSFSLRPKYSMIPLIKLLNSIRAKIKEELDILKEKVAEGVLTNQEAQARSSVKDPKYLNLIKSLFNKMKEETFPEEFFDMSKTFYHNEPIAGKYVEGFFDKRGNITALGLKLGKPDDIFNFPKAVELVDGFGELEPLLNFYDEDEWAKTGLVSNIYGVENSSMEEVKKANLTPISKDEVTEVLERDLFETLKDQVEDLFQEEFKYFLNERGEEHRAELEETGVSGSPVDYVMSIVNDRQLNKYVENVVADGSLSNGAEIVTKPFEGASGFKAAMKFLKVVFDIINKDDNLDLTDNTGLHINVGTFKPSKNGIPDPEQFDLFKLSVFLGEEYLLDVFNRRNNNYTQKVIDRIKNNKNSHTDVFDIITSNGVKEFKKLRQELQKAIVKTATKYSTINFNKLSQNYLEFRFAGGEDYASNFKDVEQSIAQIVFALVVAQNPDLYKKEYIKKLHILFGSKEAEYDEELSRDVPVMLKNIREGKGNDKIKYIKALLEYGAGWQAEEPQRGMSEQHKIEVSLIIHKSLRKIASAVELHKAKKELTKEQKFEPHHDYMLFGKRK